MEHDFSAMDRMVELGVGMEMGQQVAKSMNEMMESVRRPPEMQITAQPLRAQPAIAQGEVPQPVYRPYIGGQIAPQQMSQSPQAVGQVLASESAALAQAHGAASEQNIPPSLPQGAVQQADVYYVSLEAGKQSGPYSGTEIAKLVMERKVLAETPVWKSGMEQWKTAVEVEDVAALLNLMPPQTAEPQTTAPQG